MDGDKKKIAVNVGGKGYTLVSSDPPAYVQRVAAFADRTLRETAMATHHGSQFYFQIALIES